MQEKDDTFPSLAIDRGDSFLRLLLPMLEYARCPFAMPLPPMQPIPPSQNPPSHCPIRGRRELPRVAATCHLLGDVFGLVMFLVR